MEETRNERIQVLAKLARVSPERIKDGDRPNLFVIGENTYAVFTEEESIQDIISYFKEDLDGGSYYFTPKLIQDITGVKDVSDLMEGEIIPNKEPLRKLVEATCGFEVLVKKCLEYNGDAEGYWTYLTPEVDIQIEKDGYFIYSWDFVGTLSAKPKTLRITSFYATRTHKLIIEFNNEEYRIVDVKKLFENKKCFHAEIRDNVDLFMGVKKNVATRDLYWENGVSYSPLFLYENSRDIDWMLSVI